MRQKGLLLSVLIILGLVASAQAQTNLEACGFHRLFIVMEQLPTEDDYYFINNDCLFIYNQYMDIYRYVDSDGSWGQNDDSEFGGWPSDEDLFALWEYHWDDSLGMTVWVWEGTCQEIYESDIIFNPSYTWTSDRDLAEGNPDVVLYTPVVYHEAAHSWGLQTQNETYNYDVPTVVHAYKHNIVHDVHVIHTPDARILRLHYKDQANVPEIRNIGVFSKYAQGTWNNAYTDKSTYTAGETISAYGLTVENTGNKVCNDVQLTFYLSTNNIISTADIPIETWQWATIQDQNWEVFDFLDMPIPVDVPAGQYYLGAIITVTRAGQEDELFDDDATHLFDPITIQAAPNTFTPTETATETPTETPTDTPTGTPTDSPSASPTDTATATATNSPTAVIPTNTPTPRTGKSPDFNGDGVVDGSDALDLIGSLGSGGGGDLSGDGESDYRDLFLFASNWKS